MSEDAIGLLKEDKEVRALFRDPDKASTPKARTDKLVDQAIELLTAHTDIRTEAMNPRERALLPGLEEDVQESHVERHVAYHPITFCPMTVP